MLTIGQAKQYAPNRSQSFRNQAQQVPQHVAQNIITNASIEKALKDFIRGATGNEINTAKRLIPHVRELLKNLSAVSSGTSAVEMLTAGEKTLNDLDRYYTLKP